ncbi:[protein-PII] uridylyltransferase [Nocardioides gansuensis]|uniref:Bifunctional uridylyltransferase/uridylyl-removing enzyme n=1 Tax=Nocardioides gansuensis TaxID=2138300 RepID=A0A2T8FAE0_9ACTN|nr:[protein-PII] uridylyltransferase [Nocardioides gansuensis]PVG82647.1 [protein-PII] uridylyltransferase [Nocardioides gansuensis]
MTAAERAARASAADDVCASAYTACGGPDTGVALVAVGGYGRCELAPHSDLDVVLVHDDGVELGEVASAVWYPLWDSGSRLDHSVRSLPEMVGQAESDLKVALGLLDVRHLAGDPNLTLRLRTTMLAAWRRHAKDRLPELREMVRKRHEVAGELAHESVPDIKESEGGLRDATVLKALEATWLVDVSGADLERGRRDLLDLRDVLHDVVGRPSDRITPEHWEPLAEALGVEDAGAAQRHVRELGRRMSHFSRLTWRRVDDVLARPASVRTARRPWLEPLAPGVALSRGEVVLDAAARPASDPVLLLRAAAEAAEHDVVLAPPTAARLVRECAPLPDPWPAEARDALVRLLASGRGLLPVWETLEETGALARILPEWERIRLLPHASVIHRFTVDRHVVETCIEAGALIRTVARADVLLVAALLHDIGKGELTEHSVAGAPIAREIARRMGFDAAGVELVGELVRWHLLLSETATSRDPDDPATVETVRSRVPGVEALTLLLALTEADSRAASPKAWSTWRAGLVRRLARNAMAAAGGEEAPEEAPPVVEVPGTVRRAGGAWVSVEPDEAGARVTVAAPDRIGLLADAAATLALQRVRVRSARAWAQDELGVSVWEVADSDVDPAVLRERLVAVAEGRVDARSRLARPGPGRLEPVVVVRPDASHRATVLEVRMDDRPGVVALVCAALAELDLSVRSAHVSTVGPQAVDVFYVQEEGAGRLSDERAAAAAHAVRAALAGE